MMTVEILDELRKSWLPHTSDSGLKRVIQLLEQSSPLLVYGCFARAIPMGCLATQIAWHHPLTQNMGIDAGITWLYKVTGLNPGTSQVLRAWDLGGAGDYQLRQELLAEFRSELEIRLWFASKTNQVATVRLSDTIIEPNATPGWLSSQNSPSC